MRTRATPLRVLEETFSQRHNFWSAFKDAPSHILCFEAFSAEQGVTMPNHLVNVFLAHAALTKEDSQNRSFRVVDKLFVKIMQDVIASAPPGALRVATAQGRVTTLGGTNPCRLAAFRFAYHRAELAGFLADADSLLLWSRTERDAKRKRDWALEEERDAKRRRLA